MKPLKLHITNIGPFVGSHSVDFSNLDNIYIITGKTGSGKTTILDCITYALYGKLPGARTGTDKRHLRSDFCSSKEASCIHFDFSLNGTTYKVERTLPFSKVTKKGTTSEEGESAILYSVSNEVSIAAGDLFSQSDNLTVIESQKSKVDDYIEKLLLLSIDEFTRIVLLPQGEFATFLKQNSKDRKGLLLKLFPIEQFTRITEKIKEERSSFKATLDEVSLRLEQIKTAFNPETADEEKEKLQLEIKESQEKLELFQKNIASLLSQKETIQGIAKKMSEYKKIESDLALLQSKKEKMDDLSKSIALSLEAEKLLPQANSIASFSSELEKSKQGLIECERELVFAQNEYKSLQVEKESQEEYSKRLSKLTVVLHDLERCKVIEQNIETYEKDLTQISSKILECTKEIEDNNTNASDLKQTIEQEPNIIEKYEKSKQIEKNSSHSILLIDDAILTIQQKEALTLHENAKTILDDFVAQSEAQKIAHTASSLADNLHDGKPCPVCGSVEHPSPVKSAVELIDVTEKIRMQERIVQQAEQRVDEITKKRNILEGSITESKKTIDSLFEPLQEKSTVTDYDQDKDLLISSIQTEKKVLLDCEAYLQKISNAKQKIALHETVLHTLQEKINAFNMQEMAIKTKIDEGKKELESVLKNIDKDEKSIIENIESTTQEKHTLEKLCESFETRLKNNENAKLILSEKETYLHDSIKTLTENKENSCANLIELMKKSIYFSNIENLDEISTQIQKVLLPQDELNSAQQAITEYNSEIIRLTTLQKQFSEDLSNTSVDVENEEIALNEKISLQTKEQEEEQIKLNYAQQVLSQLTVAQSDYINTEKRFKDIYEQYERYSLLFNVISGNNQKKTPLDAWILSMYLQEITLYANSRLKKMSNNRFELHLKEGLEGGNAYKGLDLEIYDDYTGKSRPTSTLSGGETFMTSISLALAISDMVQAQNGGVQLDSMFIDEGFGSLDPESLEKALGILDEIRETRSVALISHVETLQSRISSQIRVNKFVSGSSIEICNTL